MAVKKNTYTVKAVNNAFEILDIITELQNEANLQLIASKTKMTRSRTLRQLEALCERGLIELEKTSGTYRLGLDSFSFAQKILNNSSVITLTHPVIEQLARKHDEAVYTVVIKGDDVLFLDMADCNQQIKAETLLGKTVPCFTNAAGKVMKALESAESIEWLNKMKFGRNKKISNPQTLASEFLTIKSNGGVAVDSGGLGDGIISIAVAVKDYAGHIIGAITMLGPSVRLVRERIENEIIPSLIESAALASEKFGYMPA
jgi:DNA-binding IclR family transcriptional regulator